MPNRLLIDTSFLYALLDVSDKFHDEARKFAEQNRSERIFPDVILPEVAYLLRTSIGYHAVLVMVITLVQTEAQLVSVSLEDLRRA
jgi:uncharacterized protein